MLLLSRVKQNKNEEHLTDVSSLAPSPDHHCTITKGTWAALATLTQHEWGARAATAHPGFCERVLDRAPMYSKEAKVRERESKRHCVRVE